MIDTTAGRWNVTPLVPVTFIRAEGFYTVYFMDPAAFGRPLQEQACEHASLNPGTLRIEDIDGNVLWSAA